MKPFDVFCDHEGCNASNGRYCVRLVNEHVRNEPKSYETLPYFHAERVDKAMRGNEESMISVLQRLRELERTVAEHDAKIGGPRIIDHVYVHNHDAKPDIAAYLGMKDAASRTPIEEVEHLRARLRETIAIARRALTFNPLACNSEELHLRARDAGRLEALEKLVNP